ncbi:Iron transporter [Gammaproteobacteria bacterium]
MGSLVLMVWQETLEAALVALLSLSEVVYAADLPTYTMVAQAGQLTPKTLEVAADQKFKIVVHNLGTDNIGFEGLPLRTDKVIAAGGESSLVITALPQGEYDFFDRYHIANGHGRIIAR